VKSSTANRRAVAAIAAALSVGPPSVARAIDVGAVDDKPIRVDITETSIVSQQFDARQDQGELIQNHGYGAWINRLNLAVAWDRFSIGTRVDSSVYWRRPVDQSVCGPGVAGVCIAPAQVDNVARDDASRYRNFVYPAKLYAKYTGKELEVTAGDAYVQFGRGLVLSLRKVDELGIDTTVRGGKITFTHDPFSFTLVGGLLNPTRIDEATGRSLVLPREIPPDPSRRIQGDRFGPQPIFGSDRVIGAQIQAGRGLPVVASTNFVRFTRCAPYRYLDNGFVADGVLDAPFGSCAPNDNETWLATIPNAVTPTIGASEIVMASQTLDIPSLWKHGNLYVEAAVQRRYHDTDPNDPRANGNALYASLTNNFGRFTSTLEVKSYRNFYAVTGAVDQTRAVAFSGVSYTNVPTAELVTQDSALGFFNACVDGGRLRTDLRLSKPLLVYLQGIYAHTKSEIPGGYCTESGRTVSAVGAEQTTTNVFDGLAGFEWSFDADRSHFFASAGARDDRKVNGDPYYGEAHAEYTFTKYLGGPYSLELTGRHRLRREENQNIRLPDPEAQWWRQGEHYTALKIAPKWVFSQGIEYTTLVGYPTYYFNGAILYRFTSESNLRIFFGQQRGGLKCVSGICKVFPAFSGARVELTLRF